MASPGNIVVNLFIPIFGGGGLFLSVLLTLNWTAIGDSPTWSQSAVEISLVSCPIKSYLSS